jgi:type IV secretion system protein VirB9
MMRSAIIAGALLLVAAPADSQVQPVAGSGDPHLQAVDYSTDRIVQLRGAPGYQLMIELSPDEQVQSVALGDTSAWQVSVSKSGGRMFLKPSQSEGSTNMTVVTSVRVYNFELYAQSEPTPDMPYTVQFRYPATQAPELRSDFVDVASAVRRSSKYRISGDRALRPESVSNDGRRTYISWPKSALIPATYATDRSGKEVIVNGMMGSDDVYVIDGVPQILTFRIDGDVAQARRLDTRKGRR